MENWQFVFGLMTLLVVIIGITLRVMKMFRDELQRLRDDMREEQRLFRNDLRSEFTSMKADLENRARDLSKDAEAQLAAQSIIYQDTFTAIRRKISDVELWVRDNCVMTEPFTTVIEGLRGDILRNRIESADRFEKQADKLDQILNRTR